MGNVQTSFNAEDVYSFNGKRDFKYIIRIGLIGDSCVGKSKLLNMMLGGSYNENDFGTYSIDFRIAKSIINQQRINILFWDFSGIERSTEIIRPHIRTLHCFILVYDISDRLSFERVSTHWLKLIQQEQSNSTPEQFILVVAKCDLHLKRQVSEMEGKQLAEVMGWKFIEISNRNVINISQLNEMVMEKMKNVVEKMMDDEWEKVQLVDLL